MMRYMYTYSLLIGVASAQLDARRLTLRLYNSVRLCWSSTNKQVEPNTKAENLKFTRSVHVWYFMHDPMSEHCHPICTCVTRDLYMHNETTSTHRWSTQALKICGPKKTLLKVYVTDHLAGAFPMKRLQVQQLNNARAFDGRASSSRT